jgi:ABC transport system ATP-binding/permease protein
MVMMALPDAPAAFRVAEGGIRIDAVGLTKTVGGGRTTLLRDVSLSIQPRELVAIVGASGAGKTTLMDALTGFRPVTSGRVLFRGEDAIAAPAVFHDRLGYVPQDDLIHRQLTIEQGLAYTARLRLPEGTSEDAIAWRVDEVLEEVELNERRHVAVHKLSGGQRKRASIAAELISRPPLLFLDEPTSGLDPGLDLRLMLLLRQLADEGRTVVLTTHAVANLAVCDKIVFLGHGGRLCFFGAPAEALAFFGVRGLPEVYAMLDQDPDACAAWEAAYRNSAYHARYIAAPLAESAESTPTAAGEATSDEREPPPAWRQFATLTRRYVRLLWSDKPTLAFSVLQAPVMGLFLGMVAGSGVFGAGKPFSAAQVTLVLLMIFNLWIGANTASREVVKENPIYLRERLVNLRVPPYIFSKALVLAVLGVIQTACYVGVVLLFTGSPTHGVFLPAWLELMLTVWLTGVAGMAMGLFISAAAANLDLALSITPSSIIPQMLLAGALFALPGSVDSLSNATIGKWAVNALGTTADLNRMYYAAAAELPSDERVTALLGQVVFNPHSYDDDPGPKSIEAARESRRPHLLKTWAVLVGWVAGFIGLASAAQWRKDRVWRR